MTASTRPGDAKARALVRLPDGRTGRVFYVPVENRRHGGSKGARARVRLPGGAVISVDPADLTLVPDQEEAHVPEHDPTPDAAA